MIAKKKKKNNECRKFVLRFIFSFDYVYEFHDR